MFSTILGILKSTQWLSSSGKKKKKKKNKPKTGVEIQGRKIPDVAS
jgi:hypothetical protein